MKLNNVYIGDVLEVLKTFDNESLSKTKEITNSAD